MPNSASNPGFDAKTVKDLAKILRDTDLTEIEVETEGARIRVARLVTAAPAAPAAPAAFVQLPATAPAASAAPAPAGDASPAPEDFARHPGAVPSPMVGTVYLQPEPGAASFVKEGDAVREGQQLFIIEAMKTMNAVTAPRAGTVSRVLVHDAQPVEFGEPLCVIV